MRLIDNSKPISVMRRLAYLLVYLIVVAQIDLSFAQINTTSIYRNDTVGVRGAFGDWNVITTREQAPPELKPNFPVGKGPNDSPLFIAIHGSEQLFMRLLTETYFDDLEAYARILGQGITGQGLEITSARISTDNSALELDYLHPALGLRFLERVALLPDSQVVRMAAWTTAPEWGLYKQDIDRVFRDVELLDAIHADSGWQSVWSDLDLRLESISVEGVQVSSENSAPAVSGALACPDPTASMLWQVESPALSGKGSELYLFGSIHVGKQSFYPLPDRIEETFDDTDFLVFEVDPNSTSDPAVLMEMQSRGLLPQGQTLDDILSPEVLDDLHRVTGSIGLPAESLMGMQPWLLTIMLTQVQMNMLGYGQEFGLESYFLSQKPPSAQILELESIQQQIGFLENLNAETFLAYTLNTFESGNEEIEALIEAWQCADKGPLTNMLFAEFDSMELNPGEQADMDALMDALYTRRNIDMANTIDTYSTASAGNYFVVVGSAHLLGEDSVVSLLREKGYTVTPVSVNR